MPTELSLFSTQNPFAYTDVDSAPRFTGFHDVPIGSVNAGNQSFPDSNRRTRTSLSSTASIAISRPRMPRPSTLQCEHEFAPGLTVTASYARKTWVAHVLADLDVTQPSNVFDPKERSDLFEAATTYAKMVDSGVTTGNVPNSGYFQNFFPNAHYKNSKNLITPALKLTTPILGWNDRGNETDPLFKWDIDPSASPTDRHFISFIRSTLQSTCSRQLARATTTRFNSLYGMSCDTGLSTT